MTARLHSRVRRALLVAVAPVLLAMLAAEAGAQGKGKGNGGGNGNGGGSAKPVASQPAKAKALPPGQARKRRTHDEAIGISRQVLVARGYTVSRIERRGDARVIYFYRGNNGKGKGRGPLMSMVVRPAGDLFVAERAAPSRESTVAEASSKEILQEVTRRLRL